MPLATPPPLLGRDAERARLIEALTNDRAVLVTGEAGIGKTTLIHSAAAMTGRTVVSGSGFATLATMPYLAVRLALGTTVTGGHAEVAHRIESSVGDGILFLDDIQWIDRDTLAVVPMLVGRIAIVAASRDRAAQLSPDGPPEAVVDIRLGPLGDDDAAAVVHRVAENLSPRMVRSVVGQAAGNPLLLQELARDGRASPTLARAIAGHLEQASINARNILRLLAVADRPLPVVVRPRVRSELLDLGLVVQGADGLAVRHALITDHLLAEMSDEDRRAAHEEIAGLVGDDVGAVLHLARAGLRVDAVTRAMTALERAPDLRDRAVLLRIAAEASDGPSALGLRIRAAQAALDVEDEGSAATLLEVDSHGNVEEIGLLEALCARAMSALGRRSDARAAIGRGRTLSLDPSGAAAHELAIQEAVLRANDGDIAGGMLVLDEADAADAGSDRHRQLGRDNVRATLEFFAGRTPSIETLQVGVDAAIREGHPAATRRAKNLASVLLGVIGPGAALDFIEDCLLRMDGIGLDTQLLRAERIQTLTLTGRAVDAVVAADELLERPTPFSGRGWSMVQRAEALCHLGRFSDADDTLRRAEPLLTEEWNDRGEALTTMAHVAYWSGRPRNAVEAATRALDLPSHYDGNYLLPGLVRAWAQQDLGQTPDPLPPAAASWMATAASVEWRAIAALASGMPDPASFDAAAAAWEGRYVLRAGVCRWAAGEAARREGRADAVNRLQRALAEAEARGFEPLAARTRRSLRLAGVRLVRPRTADAGSGLLTAREREVLGLVADGHSNIEIARRMGLGRPTVTRMLSNAMTKLGAGSRAQAVTLIQATV